MGGYSLVPVATSVVSDEGLITFTSGEAITAGAYQIGRDNASTNNLAFNVPTGAVFRFSVNNTKEFGIDSTGLIVPTGNMIKVFNTSDEVTNTESLRLDWSANVARIYTFPAGTGSARTLQLSGLNSSSGGGTINLSASTPFVSLTHTSSSLASSLVGYSGTSTASSSTTNFFYIQPSVNQSLTAGFNALLVNPVLSTVGSGTKNIALFQAGSTDRFGFRTDGDYVQTQNARTTGLPVGFTFTGATHTGVSNANYNDVLYNFNRNVQFTGGGASFQYGAGFNITPISFSAAAAQSVSLITSLLVSGGAIQGTNVTSSIQSSVHGIFGNATATLATTFGASMPGIEDGVTNTTAIHGFGVYTGLDVDAGNQTATTDRLSCFYCDAINFVGDTNTRTFTVAAGAIFNAPTAGANVTFTNTYGLLVDSGLTRLDGGVTFAASGQSTLDNYTEGTFTPELTLVGGAGNTVAVYSVNVGRYTRIGDRVFVDVELTGDGGAEGAGTGQLTLTLPITSSASHAKGYIQAGYINNGGTERHVWLDFTSAGALTTVGLDRFDGATALTAITGADQNSTNRQIYLKFSYEV